VILYLHGGGFTSNDNCHFMIAAKLLPKLAARGVPATLRGIEYTLGALYPTAHNEVLSALRHLIEVEGVPPGKIILAGDSAGGNLALGAALSFSAAENPGDGLAGLLLVSGWLDLRVENATPAQVAASVDYLDLSWGKLGRDLYVPHGMSLADPLVSPGLAPLEALTRLPATCVTAGGGEIFLPDMQSFTRRARQAGVAVRELVEPDMPHCFLPFSDFMGGAEQWKQVEEWVAEVCDHADAGALGGGEH